jgi:hypothetical protein
MEDLRVAGVGCLAAEHELRVRRPPDLLVEAGVVEESQPGPARLGWDVRGPQPGLARTTAKLLEQRLGVVVLPADRRLVRIDVLLHERAVARACVEVLGREERHGPSRIVACASACKLGYDDPVFWVGLAEEAERCGFDSVWTSEAYGSDAVSPLAWIGGRTERIKLGTAIMQMPARSPATTAATAATLDLLSAAVRCSASERAARRSPRAGTARRGGSR